MPKFRIRPILLWFLVLSIFSTIFVIPELEQYDAAGIKFEELVAAGKVQLKPEEIQSGRIAFATFTTLIDLDVLIPLAATIILLSLVLGFLSPRIIARIIRNPKSYEIYESLKNIIAMSAMLFLAIFPKRASTQLRLFFDMSKWWRFLGLLSFAIIYFSFVILYFVFPMMMSSLKPLQIVPMYVIPVGLIALVFFVPAFRHNYQQRLFWITLIWFLFYNTYIIRLQYADPGYDPAYFAENMDRFYGEFYNYIISVMMIVFAFATYIEVMRRIFTEKQIAETEIALARKIQQSLLPVIHEENEDYDVFGQTLTAQEVGGDYCDAIAGPDENVTVAVGDVSGHNMATGIMVSMLKSAIYSELNHYSNLSALAKSLNRTVYRNSQKNMYISFQMSIYNPAKRLLEHLNCGHMPLLIYSYSDQTLTEERIPNLALGLTESHSFTSQSIALRSGDIVIYYTDGLIENTADRSLDINFEGLAELITKHRNADLESMYSAVLGFFGPSNLEDDTTLLLFRAK
jgi:sigma-B regulation protein RsbU (phosphoserine phosphatase)